jgi:hypothetical protein
MSRQNNNCTFTVEGDNGELKTCSLERMTNSKTKTQVEFCYLHKPSGICKTNTCLTKASFGIDNTATYCARHAPNNYVNIKRKKCKVANCNIIPTFADPSNPRIKITCYKHFEKNQIHTLKKCLNCRRDASHVLPKTNFKIFCVTHAPPDFTRIEENTKSKKSKKSSINESKNTKESVIEPTANRKMPNTLLKENSIERESILEIDEASLNEENNSDDTTEENDDDIIEEKRKDIIEENQTEDLIKNAIKTIPYLFNLLKI